MFASGLDHPESVAFDDSGTLWAGGELGQIYRIDAQGPVTEAAHLGGFCLGITLSTEQDLWVCNPGLKSLMRVRQDGKLIQRYETVADRKLINPNHSVFDHAGNLYFTDSGTWDGGDGFVYRFGAIGTQQVVAGPFRFPNGIALSDDEQSLFVAESQTDSVLRIAIDPTGHATGTEIYIDELARVPDGLALDQAGNLYVMCYASDAIYRVSPERHVELLVYDPEATRIARPTNAAFGGSNHDDLYIANFGRWHISRLHVGIPGQTLYNQRKR